MQAVEGVLSGRRKAEEYFEIIERLKEYSKTFKQRSFAGYGWRCAR